MFDSLDYRIAPASMVVAPVAQPPAEPATPTDSTSIGTQPPSGAGGSTTKP